MQCINAVQRDTPKMAFYKTCTMKLKREVDKVYNP